MKKRSGLSPWGLTVQPRPPELGVPLRVNQTHRALSSTVINISLLNVYIHFILPTLRLCLCPLALGCIDHTNGLDLLPPDPDTLAYFTIHRYSPAEINEASRDTSHHHT